MKLTLALHRDEAVYKQYGQPETKEIKAADINIEGDARLVAETLRALADTISPQQLFAANIGATQLDGAEVYRALKQFKRNRGVTP